MGFAEDMRKMAQDLCKKFGNSCTLKKEAVGTYDPNTGKTIPNGNPILINIYSAPENKVSQFFANFGANTNLSGFYDEQILVPWFGYEMDTTWTYNDKHIVNIEILQTQDKIIAYGVTIGTKE